MRTGTAAVAASTLAAISCLAAAGSPAVARATDPQLRVGAATVSFTPYCGRDGSTALNNCAPAPSGFVDPATSCEPSPDLFYTGARRFAFEEPYRDMQGSGHYDMNDPFLDCNLDGRWDGNFLGGGSNAPRYYSRVADPVGARAMVVSNGARTIAVEVLDHEGAFNVYLDAIRSRVAALLPAGAALSPTDVFISSTHDESAPDSIGLYGVTPATSSTNKYWTAFMEQRAAQAVVNAYANLQPAMLRYGQGIEPSNLRQCWSSYPFVDDQLMPALQAVNVSTRRVIVTLADVSQHAETLGFNGGRDVDPNAPTTPKPTLDAEKTWLSADWPYWFRHRLETDYGGVGIEMAGTVGSNETPQVFGVPLSRAPQQFVDAAHPAGCRTEFRATGAPVPLGYYTEALGLGSALATAVETGLAAGSPSSSSEVLGARAGICFRVTNALFAVAGIAGVFSARPGYADPKCTVPQPVPPTGNTAATYLLTEVAAFRIGDGTFVSIPGEVFPFTYLRSFLGPQDMPCPDPNPKRNCGGPASPAVACAHGTPYALPPWLMPHMHTQYRFIDGLGEDMVGYIFPCGNGVGVPGEYPVTNPSAGSTDRFGCGHSDDSESASSDAADAIGAAGARILDTLRGRPQPAEDIRQGRYVLPGGQLSRNPLGTPDSIGCSVNTTFSPTGPAIGIRLIDGTSVNPAAWMSLSGTPQSRPDRNTRGWIDGHGTRHWLDVFADMDEPAALPEAPGAPLLVAAGITALLVLLRTRRRRSR